MKTGLRKGLLAVLLIVLGLLVPIAPVFGSPFAGGDGTSGNLFQITNWHHLNNVRHHLGSHFILMNNLDSTTDGYATHVTPLGGLGWLPIGTEVLPFTGNFNGQGREIRDLFINRSTTDLVGLFGVVGAVGVIRNVGVVNVNVTGGAFLVGGLVGVNWGTINNSYASGSVTGGRWIGGLVGGNNGTVSNSFATGNVTGSSHDVGSLVGVNHGTVTNSYATGSVTGNANNAGGLVGLNWDGTVSNSYATGSVTGMHGVGGLVGVNLRGTVRNSYATGSVTGTTNVGGLVGDNRPPEPPFFIDSTVTNSYATGNVTGTTNVGGLVGGNWGTVTNSYATGSVIAPAGATHVGGLVGAGMPARVINSFWDTQTSGQATSAGGTAGPPRK
jgi:hypothetical protein